MQPTAPNDRFESLLNILVRHRHRVAALLNGDLKLRHGLDCGEEIIGCRIVERPQTCVRTVQCLVGRAGQFAMQLFVMIVLAFGVSFLELTDRIKVKEGLTSEVVGAHLE